MKMKTLMIAALIGLGAVQTMTAEETQWMTYQPKAVEVAKAQQKLVLLNFTGSDWCPWCIKLDKEVFDTPEFKKYAAANLVLVEVDFPNHKPQPAAVEKANRELQEKYNIDEFPTVLVLNGDGKTVGKLGYQEGGPRKFIAALEKIKKG
jgi:protein disulfide-isomerase